METSPAEGTKFVLDLVWNEPLPDCPFPVRGHFVQLSWTATPGELVRVQVGQLLIPASPALRYDRLSDGNRGFVACGRETTSVQTAALWFLEGVSSEGRFGCKLPCGTVFPLQ